jgi:hypothetical protein
MNVAVSEWRRRRHEETKRSSGGWPQLAPSLNGSCLEVCKHPRGLSGRDGNLWLAT